MADVIVVINPFSRGFAMSSGERHSRDHAVISSPPPVDENGSMITAQVLGTDHASLLCRPRYDDKIGRVSELSSITTGLRREHHDWSVHRATDSDSFQSLP